VDGAMIDARDLQGGIVRGYGMRFAFARHLFARVREPAPARLFLAAIAGPVTTEEEWAQRPATTLNVALSFRALEALEVPPAILDGFPPEFRCGMAHRADRLGDDPRSWDDELRDLEVLLVVHAQSAEALAEEAEGWERALDRGDHGLELAHAQDAALLGKQREHFGFTDGFSQPAIEGIAREEIRGQGILERRRRWWPLGRPRWRAIKPGEFVLGHEDEDGGPAPAPPPPFDRNATFMVWRKLHQDVAAFRAQLAEHARRLGLDEELVAAKIVGRWRDGSPLAMRPYAPDPELGDDRERANDFRYGDDRLGLRCPRGAHVRRANPRDALGWEGRLTARHRMLRRGMPYGAPLPEGADDDGVDRGLLFVCLQASIARQFEIVQSQWCNDGDAFGLGGQADPIAGTTRGSVAHTIEGAPPQIVSPLRASVRCRGGEYFFVPGIAALRALPALEHRSTASHAQGAERPLELTPDDES
jgi:Dyp-type peroxidase family